ADAKVRVPDELLAIPGRLTEDQLMRGRCAAQPVVVRRPNPLLPGEFVVESNELIESVDRLGDHLVVQLIPAIGTADLIAAGGGKCRPKLIHRAAEIGAQRLQRHRAHPCDRTRTVATNQDVYTGVDGGLLVEPHFAIYDSPALDADHAVLSNEVVSRRWAGARPQIRLLCNHSCPGAGA